MRVYDIALMLVQAVVALDLLRGFADLIYTAIRYSFLIPSAQYSAWLTKVELTTWMTPIFNILTVLIILALSRPIARFAAKFRRRGRRRGCVLNGS